MSKEKLILNTVRHIAMATVNEDGSAHNTPLFFIYNKDVSKIYWGSHPNSLHSRNIEREKTAYVVVFDSKEWGQGGLYLSLGGAHRVGAEELPEALNVHNEARKRWGKGPLKIEYYQSPNGQHMYVADVTKIESYRVIRDSNGHVIEETRNEISASELSIND